MRKIKLKKKKSGGWSRDRALILHSEKVWRPEKGQLVAREFRTRESFFVSK